MDPLTIGGLVWLFERIASAVLRRTAIQETERAVGQHEAEADRLRKAREEHALNVLQTTRALSDLEKQRRDSARRILRRTIKTAEMLAPKRSAFSKPDGWFGGRSLDEAKRLTTPPERTETRTWTSTMISAGSGTTLALAQIVSMLERAIPNLDEVDLQDIIVSLPVPGVDGIAEELGVIGEIGASELLGFVGVLISGAALLKAQEEAAEIRAKAREINTNAIKIGEVSKQLKDVEKSCVSLGERLRVMDYHQFKLAWASEQVMKRYPRERGLRKPHRELVDAFAAHSKAHWAILTSDPLLEAREASNV